MNNEAFEMQEPQAKIRGGLQPWQIRLIQDAIADLVVGDMSLATLAANCGLTVAKFREAFTRSTGIPPTRWLNEQRIHHANHLIETADLSLAAIAERCGFNSLEHFRRCFASVTGRTPLQSLRDKRIDRVQDLLRTTAIPLEKIAEMCGFSSAKPLGQRVRASHWFDAD